eukprot:898082-Amphidinium_carterae.1
MDSLHPIHNPSKSCTQLVWFYIAHVITYLLCQQSVAHPPQIILLRLSTHTIRFFLSYTLFDSCCGHIAPKRPMACQQPLELPLSTWSAPAAYAMPGSDCDLFRTFRNSSAQRKLNPATAKLYIYCHQARLYPRHQSCNGHK